MTFSVCLELFFTDLPFHERIGKIREAGFTAGEFWGHEGKDLDAIATASRKDGVEIVCMAALGDPGLNDPGVHGALVSRLEEAINAGRVVGCRRFIVTAGNTKAGVTRWAQTRTIIDGLEKLAKVADEADVELVLENLNTERDHPGYFLDRCEQLAAIVRSVGHPRVKGLFDVYHAGVMEGNIIEKIRDQIDTIGHFHVAGIPGRHEPKGGEQNYPAIARAIDAAGYNGYMGLEYIPLATDFASLVETREWIEGDG